MSRVLFITPGAVIFSGNKLIVVPSAGTNDLIGLIPLVVSSQNRFKNKVPSFLVTFLHFLCC